ncbi:MAG: tyrosine recombinase XerC [Atopobiaceae bacterium]
MAAQSECEELCARFVAQQREVRGLSQNTADAYQSDLSQYMAWVQREGIDPLAVSHRQLRRYIGEQVRAGYAEKTVNRRLSALKSFYKWLFHEGYCKNDVADALSGRKIEKSLPKTMSNADVEKILSTCDLEDDVGIRDRAFLELLYASGARISEISALDVDSISFEAAQVKLFGKGSKERIVPLYSAALDKVRLYLGGPRQRLLQRSSSAAQNNDTLRALFISTRSRRMSADALRRCFEAHAAQAGIVGVTPHAMRHTFATELLDGGADLKSVQELLGHENLSTTQIYTHLSVKRLKDATNSAHPRGQ